MRLVSDKVCSMVACAECRQESCITTSASANENRNYEEIELLVRDLMREKPSQLRKVNKVVAKIRVSRNALQCSSICESHA